MSEAWYDKTKSEQDKLYETSVMRIKQAVDKGMGFGQASTLIDVSDKALKKAIVLDALKVLIAERHFNGAESMDKLARKLKLPLKDVEAAKEEMLKEVEAAAIEKYKSESGQKGGNA